MLAPTRRILVDTVDNYFAGDCLTRGAAIAFYSVTSLVPVLIIVIAIAGIAFGEDAARGAIVGELANLIGPSSAALIQDAIESAYRSESSSFALIAGAVILTLTVSGVFGELQAALNTIWKCNHQRFSLRRILRDRAASIGLVVGLGFLLLVSLVLDASVRAFSTYIDARLSYGTMVLAMLNTVVSFLLTWTLFAAIYKVLPNKPLEWPDVVFGAMVTAVAFEAGKGLIGFYLGNSTVISSYGAAGALASVILWIYYSAQIFLLGACFTKACAIAEHRRLGREKAKAKRLEHAARKHTHRSSS
jgi:membrane protein